MKVYDILNAGPRHRFTVSGVLVHAGEGVEYGGFSHIGHAYKGDDREFRLR